MLKRAHKQKTLFKEPQDDKKQKRNDSKFKSSDDSDESVFDKSTFSQQWDIKPKGKKGLFEVGDLQ